MSEAFSLIEKERRRGRIRCSSPPDFVVLFSVLKSNAKYKIVSRI